MKETNTVKPTFQAKHYRAIAAILCDIPYADHRSVAVDRFCLALAKDNPKFNEDKFRKFIWERVR